MLTRICRYFVPATADVAGAVSEYSGYISSMLSSISSSTGIEFEYVLTDDTTLTTLFGQLCNDRDDNGSAVAAPAIDAFVLPLSNGIPEEYNDQVVVGG